MNFLDKSDFRSEVIGWDNKLSYLRLLRSNQLFPSEPKAVFSMIRSDLRVSLGYNSGIFLYTDLDGMDDA